MDNIRWGIIGCGDVTEIKSGPAFSKIEGSSLYMVMRRNKEKLVDYAKRHNVDRYTQVDESCEKDNQTVSTANQNRIFKKQALTAR